MSKAYPQSSYRGDIPNVDDISERTWSIIAPEIDDVMTRVRKAGAKGPLEYIGAGMTGIVFCTGDTAYKVARPGAERMVEEEAEWLATANQVPELRRVVARRPRWNKRAKTLTRECVRPKSRDNVRRWGNRRQLWDVHQGIKTAMKPYGWGAPEFKEDSYVVTRDRGPVLVDGSMPIRYGRNLVAYTLDVINGRRPREKHDTDEYLSLAIRAERGESIPKATADRVLAKLGQKPLEGTQRSAVAAVVGGVVVTGLALTLWHAAAHRQV